ncbi:hypothetical protein Hte_006848 [Hypoxylon texense]
MDFDTLPFEIIHKILIFAVRSRGIQRALRLRLVSRHWNDAVQLAIFDSGILDEIWYEEEPSRLVTEFVLYKAFHTNPTKPVSAHILVIRQAAEYVFKHHEGLVSKDAIDNSIYYLFVQNSHFRFKREYEFPQKYLKFPICRTDEQYREPEAEDVMLAVLAIVAYNNDVSLAKELIPKIEEEEKHLLYMDGAYHGLHRNPILGCALEAAAMRGNVEMTRIILGYIIGPNDGTILSDNVRGSILWHAAQGNQACTLEIGLEVPKISYRRCFVEALMSTTSLDIYKRLLDFRDQEKEWMDWELRDLASWYLDQFLHAAVHGDIPRMKYLRESPPESARLSEPHRPDYKIMREKYYPVTPAAAAGRYDVVELLLNNGVHVYEESIIAAAKSGSRRLVQLLLGKGTWGNGVLSKALLVALEREHDSVISLLMENEVFMDQISKDRTFIEGVVKQQPNMVKRIVDYVTRQKS